MKYWAKRCTSKLGYQNYLMKSFQINICAIIAIWPMSLSISNIAQVLKNNHGFIYTLIQKVQIKILLGSEYFIKWGNLEILY